MRKSSRCEASRPLPLASGTTSGGSANRQQSWLPYALMASASLVLALANQGRSVQACMIAREDLELLERIDGPVSTEVLFRVAAADVLHGAGHLAEARGVLAEALRQIDIRSTKITDPALRSSYLSGRPENRRARELEVQTVGSSGELL